ncbi:uncharacterized protein LOC114533209 [Dendronephthya gigantea]|uniref:uncharacterized protein LOC114533209 n=1 Tax=Dendronephthya gigantea TaxID=151771 RepID=UPI00106D8EE1|nr:uncharacterized protein LOC114533209 [Dendronephthya gigantea]
MKALSNTFIGDVLLFISLAFISWFQYFKVRGSHHETCDREYTKVGCVHTYQNRKRIYNELIITDRDSRSPKSSDIPTDWFHWEEYLLGLACRCVEKLNKISNGNLSLFHQFTIENYGECWSSRFGHDALHSLTKSNNCIGAGFLECQQNRPGECTGIKLSSFLYQIHNRTKLLDEHCHIVKRIVCPSSTIQWNSSLPLQSPMTDQTTFINSTRTQQHTASQVQISPSTTTLNQTISRENDSSLRVLQSSDIQNITSKEHFMTSTIDFSVVESNIENHSSDNGPIKSSQTHALITPSTAEKITNIRLYDYW